MQRPLRLRASADFARLRTVGRVVRHPLMMLSLAANDRGQNRYGFVVSRQVGNAVRRNKVRRRIREAVRLLHQAGALEQGYDLVWIARNEASRSTYTQIAEVVGELLRRARLLTPDKTNADQVNGTSQP